MSADSETAELYGSRSGGASKVADYPSAVLRIWKPSFNFAPWPIWQMMWVSQFRVLYTPIAKNACTSIKSLLARFAISEKAKNIPDTDVHGWLDNTNTGLQLGDLDEQSLTGVLEDPEVARVVVLRDPFDRLVSAYLEKFVANRHDLGTQFHTRPVIAAVTGVERPEHGEFSESITFREFVEYVVTQPSERLDPHWCPQVLYLGGLNFNHVYNVDDLQPLVELFRSLGVPDALLDLPHLNRVRAASKKTVQGAMDRSPSWLEGQADFATSSFYDDRLKRMVADYYRKDIELLTDAIQS